ncbi:MAG: Methyltransferase domain protein [Planctomycetaceae bacterium]|nr:Methyltransferase domain protein [Planctomycetaceae bacterium]
MKFWFDWVMSRRAANLTGRLRNWIPRRCRLADIGSGTGHNAQHWRAQFNANVDEFDVCDLHWTGAGPVIFDGRRIPVADATYSIVTLLFVLQYSPQALELLQEARRICAHRVIVFQSTYDGKWGRGWLRVRDFLWGPLAFYLARFAGMIRGYSCPLKSQTLFSRPELTQLFQQAGLTIHHWEPQEWWGLRISRDLYILESTAIPAKCPS